jgi:mono/diheme cytochrome c family protein
VRCRERLIGRGGSVNHMAPLISISFLRMIAYASGLVAKRTDSSMRPALSNTRLLVVAAIGLSGSAVIAADANHGAELAKRWCATCHLVENSQPQANADVPPFATIASRSDFTPEKVAFFLLDPHPKMPNFPLSRNEAADIAAYIASLRK